MPDGDTQAGKANYVNLQCNAFHSIDGVDQIVAQSGKPEPSIALSGKVSRIKTYVELVTSIINPSHRLTKGYPVDAVSVDGKSKMKNYNDSMTGYSIKRFGNVRAVEIPVTRVRTVRSIRFRTVETVQSTAAVLKSRPPAIGNTTDTQLPSPGRQFLGTWILGSSGRNLGQNRTAAQENPN